MDCDSVLHDELKKMMEVMCPLCDQQLLEVKNVLDPCCDKQELKNVNGMNTCVNCGSVHGCDYVMEYFDFYDNMHRIRQKSVYNRKYHIENVLFKIYSENNIELTYHQREQIYKAFIAIDNVLNEVNDGRKRMIRMKYVIKELFKMLGLPYKDVYVMKSKRTLTYYKKYWQKVQSLIGDRIQSMIKL